MEEEIVKILLKYSCELKDDESKVCLWCGDFNDVAKEIKQIFDKPEIKIKPSGYGILVDKSKATKTRHIRGKPFPKESGLNHNNIL